MCTTSYNLNTLTYLFPKSFLSVRLLARGVQSWGQKKLQSVAVFEGKATEQGQDKLYGRPSNTHALQKAFLAHSQARLCETKDTDVAASKLDFPPST